MPRFTVTIQETRTFQVTVSASDSDHARDIAECVLARDELDDDTNVREIAFHSDRNAWVVTPC